MTENPPVVMRAPRNLESARNLLTLLAFLMLAGAMASLNESLILVALVLATPMLFAAAVCHGVRARLLGMGRWQALGKFALLALGYGAAQIGMIAGGVMIAMYFGNGFRRGRQVRERGKVLLAEIEDGAGWQKSAPLCAVPEEHRQEIAELWRDNGLTEHASVAAFARLVLELMELRAPSALIFAAQQDGLDEMRHTELCFTLARSIDGREREPSEFPTTKPEKKPGTRTARLQRLAVDSLFDGALHEGLSARIIAKLSKRCEVPEISAVLRQLAQDEGRHAAHAWDVVEWCVQQGGEEVAAALRGAVEEIPDRIDPPAHMQARSGGWERFGLHGEVLGQEEYVTSKQWLQQRVGLLAG